MIKKISIGIGLVLSICALLTVLHTLDNYVAKAADVAAVAQRLDEKIAGDRADRIQEKVWKLEDRYRGKIMAPLDLQLYRDLIKELNDLNLKMKKKP